MTPAALLGWLADLPVDGRDPAFERLVGIDGGSPSRTPPGEGLVGYHASSVSAVVRALYEIPLGEDDVFVDLGAGLGKVVFLVAMLTPARVRGVELQTALVLRARRAAEALGLGARVTFDEADARDAPLGDGTVFFLYAPFTGDALARVLVRLRAVAVDHAVVVVALGVDLARASSWLVARPLDSFWLAIYDSTPAASCPPPSARRAELSCESLRGDDAMAVAFGRERVAL